MRLNVTASAMVLSRPCWPELGAATSRRLTWTSSPQILVTRSMPTSRTCMFAMFMCANCLTHLTRLDFSIPPAAALGSLIASTISWNQVCFTGASWDQVANLTCLAPTRDRRLQHCAHGAPHEASDIPAPNAASCHEMYFLLFFFWLLPSCGVNSHEL